MQISNQAILMRGIYRCLVTLSALFLSACALWGTSKPQAHPVVLFSHSEANVASLPANSNVWSPTQWAQASPQPAATTPVAPRGDIAMQQNVTLFFATDVDQLSPSEANRLSKFFESLEQPGASYFEIRGHTDNQHTAGYNQGLSARRAKTVAQWLQMQGISPQRIRVDALGLSAPIANNGTEIGGAQNRRVEVRVFIAANAR